MKELLCNIVMKNVLRSYNIVRDIIIDFSPLNYILTSFTSLTSFITAVDIT